MSVQSDTRIFNDMVLRVRNAADDDWIEYAELTSFSIPGVAAPTRDTSTASGFYQRRTLPDNGSASAGLYDNRDNAFQQRVRELDASGDLVRWQAIYAEGTKRMREFTAYVDSFTRTGQYNDGWVATINFVVDEVQPWAEPDND